MGHKAGERAQEGESERTSAPLDWPWPWHTSRGHGKLLSPIGNRQRPGVAQSLRKGLSGVCVR